ncbi:NADH:flavin oxidoreductase/NADH oxidase [Azospirillum sp. 412522]|nr:NADH:flavin oxidoreductase/NADH oxidase [Azospirillum sp. 412522]MBY6264438.1 NADH:flavin oxidoreductase/NADH oxidase [Azospirillum sp. 412522]
MPSLFDPITLRGVTLRNRIGVSPMCQYSSVDGEVNDWHLVHLGSRAAGGAGLVLTEGTAVLPEGRITPSDLGLWRDGHVEGHARLVRFLKSQGAAAGIQIAHAGRKAARLPPWELDPREQQGRPLTEEEGAWPLDGASPLAFDDGYAAPREMTGEEIRRVVEAFAAAARRADAAGYDWLEVHAAHGYLLHSFNSPLSNRRGDDYGGTLENRCRITREVAQAVRSVWPAGKVLSFRLSHTDWADGGWTTADTVQLARWLKEDGVDLIDVSSGGNIPRPTIPFGPGYQVPGAEAVRSGAGIPVAAVGMILEPAQADGIIREGRADLVYLGREMLRDPYWPLRAAVALGRTGEARVPVQYNTAWMRLGTFALEPLSVPRISSKR